MASGRKVSTFAYSRIYVLRMAWKNNKELYSKSKNVCEGKHDAQNLSYYPSIRAVALR